MNHINPGGACIVTYRLSEAAPLTGVQVGEIFFPAYPVTLSGKSAYVAYFALPMEAAQGKPQIRIIARDRAGNEAIRAVPALILKRKFRSDKMVLSDNFLGTEDAGIPGGESRASAARRRLRPSFMSTPFCGKTLPRRSSPSAANRNRGSSGRTPFPG